MAAKKHSDEVMQAVRMLEALSDAKRAAVLQLIRALAAEDEDPELTEILAEHPEWAEEDRAACEAFGRGDYSGLTPASEVHAHLRKRRKAAVAHVPTAVPAQS
jgi:hypothetical protein